MPNDIYSGFVCESINICANPRCNQPTDNPKYCSLSCVSTHRGILNEQQRRAAYDLNPKMCLRDGCDNPIQYVNRKTARYCSRSCSATVNNTRRVRRPVTEEFRKKMQQINARPVLPKICQNCSIIFYQKGYRKTCSQVCARKLNSVKMKEYIRKTPSHKYNRSPVKQSWMESSFETWLNENDIKKGLKGYLTEIRFYNANTKKNGRADFVFPKLRLIIELDGTHHKARKELDNIRDAYLNQRGWKVLRISYAEYKKQSRLDEVKQLLKL